MDSCLKISRGIVEAVMQKDPTGLMRSGAIVAGLTVTTVGYLIGRVVAILSNPRSVVGETDVTVGEDMCHEILPEREEVRL